MPCSPSFCEDVCPFSEFSCTLRMYARNRCCFFSPNSLSPMRNLNTCSCPSSALSSLFLILLFPRCCCGRVDVLDRARGGVVVLPSFWTAGTLLKGVFLDIETSLL